MTYLTPILALGPELALAGAGAMAIPVAIHLLSRYRRQQHVWGAMRFILEAYRRHKHRLRLEQLLLLLVRCAIPLALGFALWDAQLTGLGGTLSSMGASDRLVLIVIDDALSAGAADGDATRLDRLRDQALALIDGLGRTDRVAVWRASRPGSAVLVPATFDHQAARRAIEDLSPRFSRSDLPATLERVEQYLDEQPGVPPRRVLLAVLSDFSRGAIPADGETGAMSSSQLAALGARCRIVVSQPLPTVPNTSFATMQPRRHMIVLEPGAPALVPVTAQLARAAPEAPNAPALASVEFNVLDRQGNVLGSARREHRWSAGQTEATLSVDVPVATPGRAAASDQPPVPEGRLIVQARLQPDALPADDLRHAIVEVRHRLRVALVDTQEQPARQDDQQGAQFDARRWLTLALAPRVSQGVDPTIAITPVAAHALDDRTLQSSDAALVIRPDLLGAVGWTALRNLADRGGLVWIVPPASDTPAVWGSNLRQALGLDWDLSMEPVAAEDGAAWAIDASGRVPEALRLLSADWEALLAPVRVYRRFPLTVADAGAHAWLSLAGAQEAEQGPTGAVLLASAQVGSGHVLMLASPIDVEWTNLPTKPLFVPLLHESLRGLLGESSATARLSRIVAGDAPLLGLDWDDAQELVRLSHDGTSASLLLRRTDEGLEPIEAFATPGVYESAPLGGRLLAVQADPAGSDTTALDQRQVAAWFQGVADWQWLDPDDPAAVLADQATAFATGWPLLWTVLGLVLVETAMARSFSHAKVPGRTRLFTRALRYMRGGEE